MVCWDIGANIGYYTCLLGQSVGPTGRVVAFEPARETRERLAHNIGLNKLANVEVSPLALGGAEGVARIHYRDAGLFEGTASLSERRGQTGSEEVQVATLDSLLTRFGAPDFLKIDVEGAQLDVWRGGRGFFSSRHPLVLAELRDSADPAVLAAIEATVRGYGYVIFSIHKGCRVSETPRLAAGGPRNYMLAKAGSEEERRLRSLRA
jgi:FkbM family methyltransferase